MNLTEVGFAHLQALKDVFGLIDEWIDGCARHDGSVSWYCVEEEDLKELKKRITG